LGAVWGDCGPLQHTAPAEEDKLNLKLYLVTLQGPFSYQSGYDSHKHYVVAENPDEAYLKVFNWMERKQYGFSHARQMKSVEQIATCGEFGGPFRLWV
jgi:hypothetical protein